MFVEKVKLVGVPTNQKLLVWLREEKGLPSFLVETLVEYSVLVKSFSGHVKHYPYIGFKTENGMMLRNHTDKMKALSVGEKEHLFLGNQDSTKVILFSSVWDYYAYLALCGEDKYLKVLETTAFIVLNNPTLKGLKLFRFPKEKKIVIAFHNNERGDKLSKWMNNIYGASVMDARKTYVEFLSLNNKIKGVRNE